jgi:FAD/FMN-containing dehydrogenase
MGTPSVDISSLSAHFSGRLLRPGDGGYDDARRIYNGLIDRQPALIAQTTRLEDVMAAIEYARTRDLEVAVRAGGHGVAGRATVEEEHPDLFWGLRGGGGNFGVAASLRFRLHPVGPMVFGGLVAHPLERGGELLRLHRELTETAPDHLMLSAGLLSARDGTKLAAIVGCWCGDPEDGARTFQPVRDFGQPVISNLGPIDYCAMNSLMDASFPKGALYYGKSRFVDRLEDAAIESLLEHFAECPSPMTAVVLDHWHGAATRMPPDATAFPHRREGYSFWILSQWLEAVDTNDNVAWTRETYAAMRPHSRPERYVNYADRDDAADSDLAESYGQNRRRLENVKATYDPTNFFHLNANILPAA